jgi:hypothetical protein
MSAPRGYGVRRPDGELMFGVMRWSKVGAIREAVWCSRTKPGVRSVDLQPMHSCDPLNEYERASWRWLYRQGCRIVRVELREVAK